MRILMTSALGLLALASLSVAADARPCPDGWVRVCEQSPPDGRLCAIASPNRRRAATRPGPTRARPRFTSITFRPQSRTSRPAPTTEHRGATMRTMTSALSLLALLSLSAPVEAAPCPFPQVRVCEPTPNPPVRPPMCHCANSPGSPTWGGRAEIHKKNVPTVKPNKSTGSND